MPELLNDPLVYLQTNKDPTRKYQDKVNGIIAVLLEESVICDQKARYLKAHNTLPPRLYELRKIHKPGCKLRPVVSCIKSPCYKLAKFLHGLLTPLINTFEFNIRNSTEMVRFINNTRLPPDYILVSLDVVSLFTNIPKALVLEIINEEYETIRELVKVSKGKLCSLINVCFKTSYFTFNNVFYLQLDGSSMGNPASPVLANLVMDYVLWKIVDSLPFHVPFLKLYMDDTLLAMPGDEVDGLLDHFNRFHEKIQFTMEREQDGELAFLDTIVIRMADEELRTKWFQKPTSSGRLLNFNSHHPLAHKTSVALGLIYRAVTLNHSMYHQENLKKVRVILKRNNYPTKFIDCCIN
ncbi:GSCOCG00011838001-RA-CDS, partial [Cotesia congregata]